MSMILPFLMLLLIFAVVATCFSEGIWSNVFAWSTSSPRRCWPSTFSSRSPERSTVGQPSYTYLWDFLSLWVLFSVFLLIFREITDRVSRVNVRFLKLADRIGGVVLSLWIGYVMVCFTMMTLHTAPLGRNFLFEGFSTQTDARMFFGFPPDRDWLGFTQKMSTGAFAGSSGIRPECRIHAEIRDPPHRT